MVTGYRERLPPGPLTGSVACLWRDDVATARRQRVLPDGCMDLIWMDGALHVAGPDTTAFSAATTAGRPVTGLRFRPGAAPGVLGVPAYPLRDQRVPLSEFWPEAGELTARIDAGGDPEALLLAVVASRMRDAPPSDPGLRLVVEGLSDGRAVADIADALGCTQRSLHRRCRGAFGYGPSVLRRILRFRSALALAGTGTSFADTAARTGYADQAHLAREVRALAGAPLSELLHRPTDQPPSNGANRSTVLPSGSCSTA